MQWITERIFLELLARFWCRHWPHWCQPQRKLAAVQQQSYRGGVKNASQRLFGGSISANFHNSNHRRDHNSNSKCSSNINISVMFPIETDAASFSHSSTARTFCWQPSLTNKIALTSPPKSSSGSKWSVASSFQIPLMKNTDVACELKKPIFRIHPTFDRWHHGRWHLRNSMPFRNCVHWWSSILSRVLHFCMGNKRMVSVSPDQIESSSWHDKIASLICSCGQSTVLVHGQY